VPSAGSQLPQGSSPKHYVVVGGSGQATFYPDRNGPPSFFSPNQQAARRLDGLDIYIPSEGELVRANLDNEIILDIGQKGRWFNNRPRGAETERPVYNDNRFKDKDNITWEEAKEDIAKDKQETEEIAARIAQETSKPVKPEDVLWEIVKAMHGLLVEARNSDWSGKKTFFSGKYRVHMSRGTLGRNDVTIIYKDPTDPTVERVLRLNEISIALVRIGIFYKGEPEDNIFRGVGTSMHWDQCYPSSPLQFWEHHIAPWWSPDLGVGPAGSVEPASVTAQPAQAASAGEAGVEAKPATAEVNQSTVIAAVKSSSSGDIITTTALPLMNTTKTLFDTTRDTIRFDSFGLTPYRYGLIIDDTTLKGNEKQLLEFLATRPTSNSKSKFVILINTSKGKQDFIRQWDLPRENVLTMDEFLTLRGFDLSTLESDQQRLVVAAGLLKNQIGQNQPIGVIAGPSVDIASLAEDIQQQKVEGVFISSQQPADVTVTIDDKPTLIKDMVLFEALLADILTKLHSYDHTRQYSIQELVNILPAITSQDFIKAIDSVKRALEEIAKAA
jgi:hypothetical protein